jgi:hypothetical protein
MSDHPLILRRDRTQATMDHFIDKPFAWGRFDCAKMIAWHLRQFGVTAPISRAKPYTTALGARRALARLGISSLAEQLDKLCLMRIAPAMALVGDIVAMPSEGDMDALSIALGNGAVLGYAQDAPGASTWRIVRTLDAAWRVPA